MEEKKSYLCGYNRLKKLKKNYFDTHLAPTSPLSKQLIFGKSQRSSNSRATSRVSYTTNGVQHALFVSVASKVCDQPRTTRKQYDTNTSLGWRDAERGHDSFDEVETSPEVSSTISLDTTGAVNQEGKVKTPATNCKGKKENNTRCQVVVMVAGR